MHRSVQRRARPMDLVAASPPDEKYLGPTLPEATWISPIADERVLPVNADPAEVAEVRDSVRLAFVTALQHLPGRQRAALILCEVLRWQASEVAELLDTSTAAVNSALQRARATLAATAERDHATSRGDRHRAARPLRRRVRAVRHVAARRRCCTRTRSSRCRRSRCGSRVRDDIVTWMVQPGPSECRGSRLIATWANGCPAFGQYRPDPAGGYAPWALQVIETSAGRIASISAFLDVEAIFPTFGLPAHLPPEADQLEQALSSDPTSLSIMASPPSYDGELQPGELVDVGEVGRATVTGQQAARQRCAAGPEDRDPAPHLAQCHQRLDVRGSTDSS